MVRIVDPKEPDDFERMKEPPTQGPFRVYRIHSVADTLLELLTDQGPKGLGIPAEMLETTLFEQARKEAGFAFETLGMYHNWSRACLRACTASLYGRELVVVATYNKDYKLAALYENGRRLALQSVGL